MNTPSDSAIAQAFRDFAGRDGMTFDQAHVLKWIADAARELDAAQPAAACGCGESSCVEPWEPGCGLGSSAEHAVVQPQPDAADAQAVMAFMAKSRAGCELLAKLCLHELSVAEACIAEAVAKCEQQPAAAGEFSYSDEDLLLVQIGGWTIADYLTVDDDEKLSLVSEIAAVIRERSPLAGYPDSTGWAGPGHARLGDLCPACGNGTLIGHRAFEGGYERLHCDKCGKGSYGLNYPGAAAGEYKPPLGGLPEVVCYVTADSLRYLEEGGPNRYTIRHIMRTEAASPMRGVELVALVRADQLRAAVAGFDEELQAYRGWHHELDSILMGAGVFVIEQEGDHIAAMHNTKRALAAVAGYRRDAVPDDAEAVAACLGDDAAAMLDENDEDERAISMQRAAEII